MQFGAGLRVAKRFFALLQRKQYDGFPGCHSVEVLGGLQRVTQVAGPRHDELVGAMPLAHHVLGFRQLFAPAVGSYRLLGDVAIEDRPPAVLGYLSAEIAVAAKLDNPTPHLVRHARHGENLRPRRRDWSAPAAHSSRNGAD